MELRRHDQIVHLDLPVRHGGTTRNIGTLLMPGVTAETDDGVLITGATAVADAFGILKSQLASSVTDTDADGTAWNVRPVELLWAARVIRCEYDLTDTLVTASSSGTTITITSLEDNIDSGWIYIVAGDAIGQLVYLVTSASGSAVSKTALSPVAAGTDTAIKILPLFHQLAKINSTADKIGTDAAVGSWTILVIQNWIRRVGTLEALDPTKHENTGLNSDGSLKFFADLAVRNTAAQTTE